MPSIPLISIVGRPNVGKSTLFNRLMGKRLSIVDDMPGVTRDRIFGRCMFGKKACHLVDTGGLTWSGSEDILSEGVEQQILASMDSSAALIFVTDALEGLTPEDKYVADEVRKRKCPVIVVTNKADGPKNEESIFEVNELGLGEPLAVSAQHGRNIDVLKDLIAKLLPKDTYEESDGREVRFCVVGRPNVGKSSITNAILGEERCVVSPVPGTTRDRVDTEFEYKDEKFVIVDTAGIRRRKMKMDNLEYYSYARAKGAVKDSDVVVLVLDAEEGLLEGDKRIVSFVQEFKKGLLVAVNKMDLIEDPDFDTFLSNTFRSAPFLRYTPFVFVSALETAGMDSLLGNVTEIHSKLNELLPLELLKNVIYDTRVIYSPRTKGGRVGEIKDVVHDRSNPPRIVIKVNKTDLFPPDYMRLLENRIRAVFDLTGVSLDIALSEPPPPVDAKPRKKRIYGSKVPKDSIAPKKPKTAVSDTKGKVASGRRKPKDKTAPYKPYVSTSPIKSKDFVGRDPKEPYASKKATSSTDPKKARDTAVRNFKDSSTAKRTKSATDHKKTRDFSERSPKDPYTPKKAKSSARPGRTRDTDGRKSENPYASKKTSSSTRPKKTRNFTERSPKEPGAPDKPKSSRGPRKSGDFASSKRPGSFDRPKKRYVKK